MLELKTGFEHDTVAVRASGVISAQDYEAVLLPAIEAKLRDHASIRLWYEFSEQFEGISVGALWDDAVLGLFHLNDFSRIAIVADDPLMRTMAKTLASMIPCSVRVFGLAERVDAKLWFEQTPS
ncbi:STAS/SEC14 domain-containing protein [Shewanella sp. AS16]|uniref:STAS/SEC14 domain-containing protein n=1 Tax=Shewanella sp. AS16 TaxID=2907625 RepID=UPI001F404757|nr:STAS/SEC14 domain-containing protein [Shewanella sp. AS16]MCE9687469.1 STAS/SEC14 domain-containing protein [Shewanella sp. AS16]